MSVTPSLLGYLNLIPPPNLSQPKFMAWVQTTLQPLLDIQSVLKGQVTAFDIGHAVGTQLDTLGHLLGLSRTVNFNPGGGLSPILTDNYYRLVLYAQVLKNGWKGTIGEIYDFWKRFFPQFPILIQDTQSMTLTVTIFGMADDLTNQVIFAWDLNTSNYKGWDQGYWGGTQLGMLKNLVSNGYFLPSPAGVHINYVFSTSPVFAFDNTGIYEKGWDQGNWT